MFYKIRRIAPLVASWMTRGVFGREKAADYTRFAELGLFDLSPFHLSRHPDDFFDHGRHPEFSKLYGKYCYENVTNNAGDAARLWALILNIKDVLERGVQGDFAELGVWRGNTAVVLAHYGRGRNIYLFDTFEGFDARDLTGMDAGQQPRFSDTSLELVRRTIADEHDVCDYVKGRFPDTLANEHREARYAVVNIDCDLQEPTAVALAFFYPRLNPGGVMFVHDYGNAFWPGVRAAVDAFCAEQGLYPVLMSDKSGSVVFRKPS